MHNILKIAKKNSTESIKTFGVATENKRGINELQLSLAQQRITHKNKIARAATQCEKNMTSKKEVTSSSKNKERKTYFRWSTLQFQQLIDCISVYKSKMTFMDLDFDAENVV